MSDEKTEEPSQKKLDDSRKKGQVWKSKDLTGVLVFLVGLGALKANWQNILTELKLLFRFSFEHLSQPDSIELATYHLMQMALRSVLTLSIPIIMAGAVVGGLAEFLQVGALFTME